ARAYGFTIAVMVTLTAAALTQLRRLRRDPTPFRTPGNFHVRNREVPLGLLFTGGVVAISAAALIVLGDIASLASAALITAVTLSLTSARRRAPTSDIGADADSFDLLPEGEL